MSQRDRRWISAPQQLPQGLTYGEVRRQFTLRVDQGRFYPDATFEWCPILSAPNVLTKRPVRIGFTLTVTGPRGHQESVVCYDTDPVDDTFFEDTVKLRALAWLIDDCNREADLPPPPPRDLLWHVANALRDGVRMWFHA
jgi:hypothetical protein